MDEDRNWAEMVEPTSYLRLWMHRWLAGLKQHVGDEMSFKECVCGQAGVAVIKSSYRGGTT